MRFAHRWTPWCLALAAITLPLWAHAQTQPAPQAASDRNAAPAPAAVQAPAAPSRVLRHTALPVSGRIAPDSVDWAEANRAVAAFPRGHADVLKWEAAQARPMPAPHHGAAP